MSEVHILVHVDDGLVSCVEAYQKREEALIERVKILDVFYNGREEDLGPNDDLRVFSIEIKE